MHRLLVALVLVSCSSSIPVTPSVSPSVIAATAASSRPSPISDISRDPASLPVFPEEATVVQVLRRAGVNVSRIARSHYESFLGEPHRARIFLEGSEGVDIVFLEEPIRALRICVSATQSGFQHEELFIGERLIGSGDGSEQHFYLVSDRYFISGMGGRFRTPLEVGLGTKQPPC